MKTEGRPSVIDNDDYQVIKTGSHYVFKHAYEVKNPNDPSLLAYKHIVLTQDL